MEWWNDLWLNEGFAKFMEFISLDLTYPELHVVRAEYRSCEWVVRDCQKVSFFISPVQYTVCTVHTLSSSHKNNKKVQYFTLHFTNNKLTFSQNDFFLDKCFEAMEVDSLSSSHPVSTHVENPTQIQEMFDDVSYDKVSIILTAIN